MNFVFLIISKNIREYRESGDHIVQKSHIYGQPIFLQIRNFGFKFDSYYYYVREGISTLVSMMLPEKKNL